MRDLGCVDRELTVAGVPVAHAMRSSHYSHSGATGDCDEHGEVNQQRAPVESREDQETFLGLGPSPPFKSYNERQNLCDLSAAECAGT